ncbi:MAG: peptidoglycan editing factor PgeF [Novosphingobium sp.]|nr:peptidoglycan editing factor PgeF [Novosphingobium sp.]
MAEAVTEAVEINAAEALTGIAHGFLGRRGGVSTGDLSGLNTGPGSGDDMAAITENRARAVDAVLPGARLVTVFQIHSPNCAVVTEPWDQSERPQADAMVTRQRGLLLGIVTADCAPVLLADQEAGVIGAAHAGWKGALSGVIEGTVEAMIGLGARADRIAAAIGPCIAAASYEVDEAFQERFVGAEPANRQFFQIGRRGHFQFDLEAYVGVRLKRAGIGRVDRLDLDTYASPDRFYSYRLATHRGEANYGRQISLIGLD